MENRRDPGEVPALWGPCRSCEGAARGVADEQEVAGGRSLERKMGNHIGMPGDLTDPALFIVEAPHREGKKWTAFTLQ